MLVNRLPLEIVVGMAVAIRASQCLRGFIRLEAKVALLKIGGALWLVHSRVAQHQIVVRFEILGIDRKRSFEFRDGIRISPLQKKDAPEIVANHAVARILSNHLAQMRNGIVVTAFVAKRTRVKIVRPREMWAERNRMFE